MIKKLFRNKTTFRFNEKENVACIVCNHVLNNERDILLVTHDLDDGQWGFLCGQDDHMINNYKIISLKEVLDIDKSINEIYDMPLGYGAERKSKNSSWKPFKQIIDK